MAFLLYIYIFIYIYIYMGDISQYQRGSHHGFITYQVASELPAGWSQVPVWLCAAQISATLTHWHTNTHSGQVPLNEEPHTSSGFMLDDINHDSLLLLSNTNIVKESEGRGGRGNYPPHILESSPGFKKKNQTKTMCNLRRECEFSQEPVQTTTGFSLNVT